MVRGERTVSGAEVELVGETERVGGRLGVDKVEGGGRSVWGTVTGGAKVGVGLGLMGRVGLERIGVSERGVRGVDVMG